MRLQKPNSTPAIARADWPSSPKSRDFVTSRPRRELEPGGGSLIELPLTEDAVMGSTRTHGTRLQAPSLFHKLDSPYALRARHRRRPGGCDSLATSRLGLEGPLQNGDNPSMTTAPVRKAP
jgi:hypothetical protein